MFGFRAQGLGAEGRLGLSALSGFRVKGHLRVSVFGMLDFVVGGLRALI